MKKLVVLILMTIMMISCGEEELIGTTFPSATAMFLYAWGDNGCGRFGNGSGDCSEPNTDTIKSNIPVLTGTKIWAEVSAGSTSVVAIDLNNKLYVWGDNDHGQLGIGTETVNGSDVLVNKSLPVAVEPNKTWKEVSAGFFHVMAIDTDGLLYAWGDNTSGQLGNENTDQQNTPVEIEATKTWKEVSAGGAESINGASIWGSTMAIDTDGALYTWGYNASGQLGLSDNDNRSKPTKVVIGTDTTKTWAQVSMGELHAMAIDINGNLYAWGDNDYGQLGSGNTDDSNVPVKIGIKTWKQVSAKVYHNIAIDTNDKLYTWGDNSSGQLGNGGTNNQTAPIKIGDKNWKQVSAGGTNSFGGYMTAIDSNARLYTWGSNGVGQLGNGTFGDSTVPILVGTRQWSFVTAGGVHNHALQKAN